MVRSMTGFGRGQGLDAGLEFTVEIRSVNSRYFEFNCRLPRGYLFLEDKLKNFTAQQVSRGKVEMYVTIDSGANDEITVELNRPYADAYIKALKQLSEDYGILELPAPRSWIGKSLKELHIRAKLGVNIIAVENGQKTNVSPSADYTIGEGDIMVVLGDNYSLEAVQKL